LCKGTSNLKALKARSREVKTELAGGEGMFRAVSSNEGIGLHRNEDVRISKTVGGIWFRGGGKRRNPGKKQKAA